MMYMAYYRSQQRTSRNEKPNSMGSEVGGRESEGSVGKRKKEDHESTPPVPPM